jgi:Zn-dependent protease with chaperone function
LLAGSFCCIENKIYNTLVIFGTVLVCSANTLNIKNNKYVAVLYYIAKSVVFTVMISVFLYTISYFGIIYVFSFLLFVSFFLESIHIYRKRKRQKNISFVDLIPLSNITDNSKAKPIIDKFSMCNIRLMFYKDSSINSHTVKIKKTHNIILTTGLLDKLEIGEILSVIYHEIAHINMKHVCKAALFRPVMNILLSPIIFIIFYLCSRYNISCITCVVFLFVFFDLYMIIFEYTGHLLSINQEYNADKYSMENSSNKCLISALEKIINDESLPDSSEEIHNKLSQIEQRIHKAKKIKS